MSVDEVVTRSLVRETTVPVPGHDPVRFAVLTLDNGQDRRRPATFGPAGLAALDAAMDAVLARVATGALEAVALTGPPSGFGAGADLSLLRGITSPEQARALGALGHRVFGRFATAGVPSFAFVNGRALGGGLELALHCTYRSVAASGTELALPEVSLGLVPGWGGSWLLPRLAGPGTAVRVIVEDPLGRRRRLGATEAVEAGIADVALHPADFVGASLRWAASVVRGTTPVHRPEHARDEAAWQHAIAHGRAVAWSRLHGSAPAATLALDLIEGARASDRAAGFAAEDDALAALIPSAGTRASLYASGLVRRGNRSPEQTPDPAVARPVTKVGVVGAGLMARQLAVVLARRLGVPVVMRDTDAERVEAGLRGVAEQVDRLASRGRITPDEANRLRALVTADVDWAVLADCDLVVEAAFEDLAVKQEIVRELERVVGRDCVIATNTSSLSVGEIFAAADHPERGLGLHFFNPVDLMPLVEVATTATTDEAARATAFALVREIGKTAVACADTPGFVVNRVMNALLQSALRGVDEGAPAQQVENVVLSLGLPMGPYRLIELVGPRVALHVATTMAGAFPERAVVPASMAALADHEGTGPLTEPDGAGSYRLTPAAGGPHSPVPGAPAEAQLRAAMLSAVAAEVRVMLDEGVVADAQDLDLALLLGAGWPFHLGGITPFLRAEGLLD